MSTIDIHKDKFPEDKIRREKKKKNDASWIHDKNENSKWVTSKKANLPSSSIFLDECGMIKSNAKTKNGTSPLHNISEQDDIDASLQLSQNSTMNINMPIPLSYITGFPELPVPSYLQSTSRTSSLATRTEEYAMSSLNVPPAMNTQDTPSPKRGIRALSQSPEKQEYPTFEDQVMGNFVKASQSCVSSLSEYGRTKMSSHLRTGSNNTANTDVDKVMNVFQKSSFSTTHESSYGSGAKKLKIAVDKALVKRTDSCPASSSATTSTSTKKNRKKPCNKDNNSGDANNTFNQIFTYPFIPHGEFKKGSLDSEVDSCIYHDYSHIKEGDAQSKYMEKYNDIQGFSLKEPAFPLKLHQILSNPKFKKYVTWLTHGRAWKILRQKEFEDNVIPHYFRHVKLASFMRQVNNWGFKRVTEGPDQNAYYHEFFLRGMPHLSEKMHRQPNGKREERRKSVYSKITITPDFYEISKENPLPDVNGVLPCHKKSPHLSGSSRNQEVSQVSPIDTPVLDKSPNAASPVATGMVPSHQPGMVDSSATALPTVVPFQFSHQGLTQQHNQNHISVKRQLDIPSKGISMSNAGTTDITNHALLGNNTQENMPNHQIHPCNIPIPDPCADFTDFFNYTNMANTMSNIYQQSVLPLLPIVDASLLLLEQTEQNQLIDNPMVQEQCMNIAPMFLPETGMWGGLTNTWLQIPNGVPDQLQSPEEPKSQQNSTNKYNSTIVAENVESS